MNHEIRLVVMLGCGAVLCWLVLSVPSCNTPRARDLAGDEPAARLVESKTEARATAARATTSQPSYVTYAVRAADGLFFVRHGPWSIWLSVDGYHFVIVCDDLPDWIPGDLNCDGSVTFKDINPFVAYLADATSWALRYEGCNPANGDINRDGTYPSMADIQPFVRLMQEQ